MSLASRRVLSVALAVGLATGMPATALATTARSTTGAATPTLAAISPRVPTQVAVYDRQAHTTTVVSHDQTGTPGGLSSSGSAISADGSFVAFESDASLVGDDTNGRADIYLWTRSVDEVRRISLAPGGAQANGDSHGPSVSGDGGVVAFASTATNLTHDPGQNGTTSQVFDWLAATGAVGLVSVGSHGAGAGASSRPSVSLDGRVVAFESAAADLVPRDTNATTDVFLRNLGRGATLRASVDTRGRQVAIQSRRPSLSGDGGVVTFDSASAVLVPNDFNNVRDVFVRDLPPAVHLAPNPLDFGLVPLGTPSTLSVTVLSVGWTPVTLSGSALGGTNAADFVIAGDACSGQTLDFGGTCSIAVLDIPQATGPRKAALSITDSARDSPQTVRLLGGVAAPRVRFDPAVGPPGIVTIVTGSGFPPGALVTLRWDPGITQTRSPAVVAPNGTFVVGVLVFHNDAVGSRQLIVTPAPGGASFADQTAPFLVVTATLQPSGTGAISYVAPELQLIVIRR
jgi:hypothetical protein